MRRLPAAALLLTLPVLAAAGAPAPADTAEVAAAYREAAETRDRLAREEDRLRAELSAVEADVRRLRAKADATAKSLDATRREREALAKDLAALRKYFLENRVRIRKRAAAVYRRADVSSLGAGLAAADPVAALDHLHYAARIVSADAAFLREHSAKISQMRAKGEALAVREAKEKELAADLAADRAALERESARLTRLLSDLHKAARALETRLAEHRAGVSSVDREVAVIRAEPTEPAPSAGLPAPPRPEPNPPAEGGGGGPAPPRGGGKPPVPANPPGRINFVWPFPGRRPEILSFFGRQTDPVFNIEFSNSGVDIRAAEGDAVAAAAAGVVRYRGKMKGFGSVVMIEHTPEFLTLYSRLGDIAVGMGARVAAGETVGTVGPSERPGTSPFLHFEIRRNGESVDPMDFF